MLRRRLALAALALVVSSPAAAQSGARTDADRSGAERRPLNATRVTTDHLQLTTYASDEVVTPGTVFSLILDIAPRQRMHVYAPGADNYRVIGVTLEPNPLLVTRPVEYPPSEIYFFEPLNERVPVYMKPFTLTQRVEVDASREKRTTLSTLDQLTIKGTLDYQACDDKVCFLPKSVPVSYTVKLRQLDAEGANAPNESR